MLYLIVGLFAVGAVMGLIIATAIFSNKPETPKAAVFAHALFVVSGLVLLIVYAMDNPGNYPQLSLILFIIAACGGLYLAYNDFFKKQPGPKNVVIIHAVAAVAAFVVLLVFAFF